MKTKARNNIGLSIILTGLIIVLVLNQPPKPLTSAVSWTTPINSNPEATATNIWWISVEVDFKDMKAKYRSFDSEFNLIREEIIDAYKDNK